MKVFVEFGERFVGEAALVVMPTPELAQEVASKLARMLGFKEQRDCDFLITDTVQRQSWIGHTYFVGVSIAEEPDRV